jgi:ribosomal protein S18 acetylase RimI-like enzyme
MTIRPINESDISACAVILQGAYEREPYNEAFEAGNAEGYIRAKFSYCREQSLVAVDGDGLVAGFILVSASVWADGKQAILEEIAVRADSENQGVGKSLINHAEQYLKDHGFKSMMLWAKNDKRLLAFYEKQGFGVSQDSVVMFKQF